MPTTPLGGSRRSQFSIAYQDDGRLREDRSPDGEVKTLHRTETANGDEVTISTALGRVRRHTLELTADGSTRRRVIQPTGAMSEEICGWLGARAEGREFVRIAVQRTLQSDQEAM
jgi:hypothetical protein